MLLGMTPELQSFHQHWLNDADGLPSCQPHFYNLSHLHETVFVMYKPAENRLPPPVPARSNVSGYVEACRRALLDWFGDGADLWNAVAKALPEKAVGTRLTGFRDLIEHAYFTDLIKCETNEKKELKRHKDHSEPCICYEFEHLLNRATLFITVGNEAWTAVRDKLLHPLSFVPWDGYKHLNLELAKSQKPGVTDVHGVLYGNASRGKFVIPVQHTSRQNNPLRNSYVEYLKEGLGAFSEVKTSDDGA
jgi:hypothetical protein